MLLTKEVEVTINSKTFKYYKELGYIFNTVGDKITVKIKDVPNGSHIMVDILCDYCMKNVCSTTYKNYNRSIKINGKYSCVDCCRKKTKETNKIKYGVENVMQIYLVKNKIKQTMLDKYGVEHYSKTHEYKEKYTKTSLKNFGCSNPLQNENIQEKVKRTMLDKYGVENPMQSNIIREKAMTTCMKNYSVQHPLQSKEIAKRVVNSFYRNNSQKTSQQQLYLHELYGGELNYPISYYNADICLVNERITIEYDGGGHLLNIITGRETQEEHNQKEMVRNYVIKRAGYKQIRIISSKDYLPSDEILLQMLNQAKEYFNNTTHTWVEYNIDASLMRNAENKDGVFFDFGKLRKIKKAS